MRQKRLTTWEDWYLFARTELGYAHQESVEYATLRYIEEMNRSTRRACSPLPFPPPVTPASSALEAAWLLGK